MRHLPLIAVALSLGLAAGSALAQYKPTDSRSHQTPAAQTTDDPQTTPTVSPSSRAAQNPGMNPSAAGTQGQWTGWGATSAAPAARPNNGGNQYEGSSASGPGASTTGGRR